MRLRALAQFCGHIDRHADEDGAEILVVSPVPWKRPKISVAQVVFGWNLGHFWNRPRFSTAL